jgi:hypothetical protein
MVWDNEKEAPANLDGKSLTGMNKFRAETACHVLEQIDVAEHKYTGK